MAASMSLSSRLARARSKRCCNSGSPASACARRWRKPSIETILIEVPDPEGPFGAKGLGEHVLIPTAPAILNAIRHATGVLVTKIPATPTRIRAAIRDKEARR